MSKDIDIVEVVTLRKLLQRYNEDLGTYINSDQRWLLGRVLTIVDASIADGEQRKAIKDLINGVWWNPGVRPSESDMNNPHTDLRAICTVLGFELYPSIENQPPSNNNEEWVAKRYKKIAKED